jgi:hypothetical protein
MGIDDKTKVKVVTTAVEESDDDDSAPEAPAAGKDQKGGPKKTQANP